MELKATLLKIFIENILPTLGTALGAIITAALAYLTVWLRTKSKAEGQTFAARAGFDILSRATETMKNVVAHVEAELKPKIVKAAADGVITPHEARVLKEEAQILFLHTLGEGGLVELKKYFGNRSDIFISGLLERAVTGLKATPTPNISSPE